MKNHIRTLALLFCVLGMPSLGAAQPRTRVHAAPAAEAVEAEGAPAGDAPEGVVNINSATQQQLELLPGVGPSRATAILALRTRVGTFRRLEDLLQVRGIGRATLRRLRPNLRLEGQTTLAARPTRARSPRSTTPTSE